ncbi:MAG TPA: translocase [Candidatus Eisenbacteria bacterium]|nr:translocase [Candidatus Eisenbacteria bacterium]
MTAPVAPRPGLLDRLLSPFAKVRAGEALDAVLLMCSVFLLLMAYYIIKVVREPLILAGGGAELKSYTSAGQAVLLLFLIPAYGAFASRVTRIRLITGTTLFFISNLVIFYLLALAHVPGLGVAFFVWVGIFNLMVVAQFWSFANDVYTPEQGRRLFAIVGFGQTLGAILGGVVAKQLIAPLGVYQLMLVAAGILFAYLMIARTVNRRAQRSAAERGAAATAEAPLDRRGGFELVLRDRYLLLIGLLLLLLNFVNTNGEYLLGRVVSQEAGRLVAAGATGGLAPGEFQRRFIGGFYADYFTWVNAVTAFVQLFLVSRIMQRYGVRAALYVLPLVAFGGYGLLVFAPALALIRVAKIGENALDYSLNNTARQALFLPTSREAKYKAKAAIDTLFVRAGDLLSAGLVFLGAFLSLRVREFALVNLGLTLVWLLIVVAIGRRHRVLAVDAPAPATTG